MKTYQFTSSCAICGGPGAVHVRDAGCIFYGGLEHKDPRDCDDYLAQQRRAKQVIKPKVIEPRKRVKSWRTRRMLRLSSRSYHSSSSSSPPK